LNIDKFDNSGTIIDNNKGVFLKERIPTYKPLITVVLLVQIRV
ncbi:autotransporter, partial [Campylobacter jejuni]|nr:autotransporter [Campylobacter jejuni]